MCKILIIQCRKGTVNVPQIVNKRSPQRVKEMANQKLQEQSGFDVSWKLCLNLSSRKRLKPKLSLVINLVLVISLILKTLLALGQIKFNSIFRNIL